MYFTKCINYFLNPIKMLQFNSPETARRTAIYVRISTNKQQTDRQVVELKEYASKAGITITDNDIYTDIISGFKDGELRPQYSFLKQKIEAGEYQQILFSEFSRLDRKPSNLLRSIEYYQKHDVHQGKTSDNQRGGSRDSVTFSTSRMAQPSQRNVSIKLKNVY